MPEDESEPGYYAPEPDYAPEPGYLGAPDKPDPPLHQKQPGTQRSVERPPAPQAGVPAESSSKATTALVLGIAGLLCCPVVLSIPAVIYGRQAKEQIDANPGMRGRGQAQAGFILGIVSLSITAIYLVATAISAAVS